MIKAIFFDVELLVYSLFFLFSFFATITGENSIYAMLLIMTYYISTAMQYIVTALWKVAGNLLGALVLVLLVLYIMIMILYTFFKGHVGAHGCDTFYRCYLIGVDQSFKVYIYYLLKYFLYRTGWVCSWGNPMRMNLMGTSTKVEFSMILCLPS